MRSKLLKDQNTRGEFLKDIFDKSKLKASFSECEDDMEKLSFFISSVTRMRCLKENYALDFSFTGKLEDIPHGLCPWQSKYNGKTLYHGHWAALGFKIWKNNIISLDSGCVWGNEISLFEHEKNLISKALNKHNGKRKNAAKDLGISERTLYRKIKELNL